MSNRNVIPLIVQGKEIDVMKCEVRGAPARRNRVT
jgi:hypothetical protein